jgi:hypothetical protein
MITREQAITANEFHFGHCTRTVGPRGGTQISSMHWRRNGFTQTWKREPEKFRVPIKHGLRDFGNIDNYFYCNTDSFHTAENCPLEQEVLLRV